MSKQLSLLDAAQHAGPYQSSSETSFEAAVAAAPHISPQKERILSAFHIWDADNVGFTQDELSELESLPRSTVCARFNELERDGLIRKTARTRLSRYGRACAVYVLVGHAAGPAGNGSPAAGQGALPASRP